MLFHALTLALVPTLGSSDGAPRVAIHFPPSGTLTDASSVHVTGSATDADGVAAIRVNGIGATSSDGFAHWSVEVPVSLGHQQLVVESVDSTGEVDPHAASVVLANSGPFLLDGSCIAHDGGTGESYVYERTGKSILQVDSATGVRRVVAGPDRGAGPSLDEVTDIESYHSGTSTVVSVPDRVLRVDLATGDRTVLSGPGFGSGMAFGTPRALVYDAVQDRLYVMHGSGAIVLAVDPATGDRTLLSSAGIGGGAPMSSVGALAHDAAANRLLAYDNQARRLLAIDTTTGFRTTLSDDLIGAGPSFGTCFGLTVDPQGTIAYVLKIEDGAILAIDLATGDRTAVGSASDWESSILMVGDGLAFDANSGDVLVLHHDVFEALDPATGIATALTSNSRGTGPGVGWEDGIWPRIPVLLPGEDELLLPITEAGRYRYVRVDLESGDRHAVPIDATQVALQFKGGPAFDERRGLAVMLRYLTAGAATLTRVDLATGVTVDIPNLVTSAFPGKGISLDPAHERIFVGFSGGVHGVDLTTGSWSIVSGGSVGFGPTFKYVHNVLYDAAADRLLVCDSGGDQILSADPVTGNRTQLAAPTVGSGLQLSTPLGIALDQPHGRVLVTDYDWNALISVDRTTLERRVITKSASTKKVDLLGHTPKDRGQGPAFVSPQSLAIDSRRNVAFTLHDAPLEGVLCIELGSGDRVLIAR